MIVPIICKCGKIASQSPWICEACASKLESPSTDVQQLKAEIAFLVDSFDYKSIIDCNSDVINLLKRLRQLSAV